MLEKEPSLRITAKNALGKVTTVLELKAMKLNLDENCFALFRHDALRSIGKLLNSAIGGSKTRIVIVGDSPGCVMVQFRIAPTDDPSDKSPAAILRELADASSNVRKRLRAAGAWFEPYIIGVLDTVQLIAAGSNV